MLYTCDIVLELSVGYPHLHSNNTIDKYSILVVLV